MTVGELIEILSEFDEDMEVRLAQQPNWPFEYSVGDVVYSENSGAEVVYIGEGRQLDYLTDGVAERLGWGR